MVNINATRCKVQHKLQLAWERQWFYLLKGIEAGDRGSPKFLALTSIRLLAIQIAQTVS